MKINSSNKYIRNNSWNKKKLSPQARILRNIQTSQERKNI